MQLRDHARMISTFGLLAECGARTHACSVHTLQKPSAPALILKRLCGAGWQPAADCQSACRMCTRSPRAGRLTIGRRMPSCPTSVGDHTDVPVSVARDAPEGTVLRSCDRDVFKTGEE